MFNRKYIKLVQDYRELFDTERGKRVIADLMKNHYVLDSTFDPNPQELALAEGERNVVLRILSLLQESPLDLMNRIKENPSTGDDDAEI